MNDEKLKFFRSQLGTWGKQHRRDFPWWHTTDPYAILIAELLLQKTTAPTVDAFYQAFMDKYPTVSDLAEASVEEISDRISPLGLHFRALRLHQLARKVAGDLEGKIPDSEAELLKLPGVGLYTALSVLSHAFNQPAAVLDTNVARILERFFGLLLGRVKSRCSILWNAADCVAPETEVGLGI